MNRHKSTRNTRHTNINDPQKKYRLGTVSKNILLEGLNRFQGANLALNSNVDQDTIGKVTQTTNTTAKRSALSQQMITKLQGTNTTAQHTPTWNITNKNHPQKKHCSYTVSKNTFTGGLIRFAMLLTLPLAILPAILPADWNFSASTAPPWLKKFMLLCKCSRSPFSCALPYA